MSEARTDTTQARPQGAGASQAGSGGAGKHRGGAAREDVTPPAAAGRHRRPSGGQ
ncbi:hypothetical protein [Streptomyces formicae]|uniref:Uncharacterized protein n=1 Tax=Streptomyces formicae TaxID=1616117 RepID=A0ABY3WQ82_9ACTN|nr:hypothetical protein [Streptomyces formicae]UNM14809.1 hypothetical protein J4032_28080 [Streptomyces formicae]